MDAIYNRRGQEGTSSSTGPPSQAWIAFAGNAFADVTRRLQEALQGNTLFKDDKKFKQDYKKDELR